MPPLPASMMSLALFGRCAMRTASSRAEDYVEAIHAIAQRDGRCRVCDLARHMGVSHVTVTRTLTRLRAGGLLETAARQP